MTSKFQFAGSTLANALQVREFWSFYLTMVSTYRMVVAVTKTVVKVPLTLEMMNFELQLEELDAQKVQFHKGN